MNMRAECLSCLYEQMLRVCGAVGADEKLSFECMRESAGVLSDLDMGMTPPEAASILYPMISERLGKEDPYMEKKIESTDTALSLLPTVRERVAKSDDRLDTSIRASVAGNVIDFASQRSFGIGEELERIFEADFSIDHRARMIEGFGRSERCLIIGDNAGEHIMDLILAETLSSLYPDMEIVYMTRGRAIINDLTYGEALRDGMDRVVRLVDSGVDTPCFLYDRASREARDIYDSADLIIAKGMGNFECMDELSDERLYFLFKVKCSVVADRIGCTIGDIVCANSVKISKS